MKLRISSTLSNLLVSLLAAALWLPAVAKAHDLSLLDAEFAQLAIEETPVSTSAVTTTTAKHTQPCPELKTCCQNFRVRAQDQVWVISSRHLGCATNTSANSLQAFLYEKGMWQPKPIAEFYATDSVDVVTTFYIHGNRIDAGLARADGLAVYFQLVGKFEHQRAVRFVIYSWPSDQIKGPLKDVRAKAYRADEEAFLVSRFVGRIQKDVPIGLIGYSYGARIILGSMHLLGGGSFGGRATEPSPGQPIRVALWAAAEHNCWPLPGHAHGQALGMADHWFITINGCDPALQRYAMVDKCESPTALGYAGFGGGLPTHLAERVELINVSNIVGGSHDMRLYLYAPSIAQPTAKTVLWYDLKE
ncbi:hypothetical protein ETAA8_69930 [Anatilimnocola aggregata]|uniref:Uncharacterized protein n=1 Tax=Anatilimnocola aggregata TaxID=2528021 RepID=A0A517YNM9_9BACT|nr:hypothetical protein [Anatilimnocola aggregata]QDU31833.1 hypothetical protein ETAA8_69930 [Anatilimnocola aggregata]